MNLSYWLRKSPQPSAVLADDKKIEVQRNRRAWRDLTETIKALKPSKLTCLNASGEVIRSVALESDEDDEGEDKAPVSAEVSDLQYLAKLLAEAYREGRTGNQPIIDSAMQFVERQSQRLAAAEREIDRLRTVVHKQHLQIAELTSTPAPAAAGGEDSIMGALVAGIAQGAAGQLGIPPAPTPIIKTVKK